MIHAVGPVYWKARKTNEHASLLASCYAASLRLAVENGLDVIAFPPISAGVFGYPSYEAAEVAISTVRDFLERAEQEGGAEGRRLRLVVFCTFESKDEIAYIELLPLVPSTVLFDVWLPIPLLQELLPPSKRQGRLQKVT